MSSDDFRFELDCARERVTPRTLNQAVSVFSKVLSAADASDWRVSSVELHSIALVARPTVVDENAERAFGALNDFANMATRVTENDANREEISRFGGIWSPMSDLIKETGADITVVSRDVEGVFTPVLMANVSRLLVRSARRSFGHVRGRVDKIILQPTHRTLGLVDCVTQNRVDAKFGTELDPVVQQIQMGMEVDIRGFARVSDGVLLSMEAEEIEITPARHHALVTAENLEGTIGMDFTGGLGSVDFVSALRDSDVDDATTGAER